VLPANRLAAFIDGRVATRTVAKWLD